MCEPACGDGTSVGAGGQGAGKPPPDKSWVEVETIHGKPVSDP